MPGSTSIYGLPYLVPDDPPDIARATKDLANAAETQLQRVDAAALGTMVGFEATSEVTPQAIAATTLVAMRWQAASSNVGGFGKPSAFEWTVPTAGVYAATVQGTVTNGQTGRAFAQAFLDGRPFRIPFGGFTESGFGTAGTRRMAAGTIIKVEIYCATATTLGVSTLAVYRIGS
ncbi:hypothetical protein ABZ807_09510 [Micromonospora sp. NPDC047548]|uniref:hypothetical protein n=1 Tax=Micromonospora sp. NPDC047548 TaxID=3155624 RepID=UPI0034079041